MPPRAKRIAAPGARRVTVDGVMGGADGFGRLRILVVAEYADGRPNTAHARLSRMAAPYAARPNDGDVRGVLTVTLPERHRAYWLEKAAGLRGAEVRVEATVRGYLFAGDADEGSADAGGTAFDLVAFEPLAPAGK